MEGENRKRLVPSVPTNFLTLAQLQERWLREKQKQKEEDEKEAARLQKQREEEQEEEDRNRREKEEQDRKLRIQQTQKKQNEYGFRPRSNNAPRPPFHRNRLNQCPGRGLGGVDEQKPAKTHVAEETGRTGSERGKPFHRNRQNQSPVGGSGDNEMKRGKTHVAEVVPEDAGVKIDDDSIKRTGSEKRGNPGSVKEDSTGDLLPGKGADKEVKVGGEGRIGEKKDWVDGSLELERKFEKISLSGGGGGEGFNGRHSGYVHGGGNRRNYDKGYGGIDWRRKRNSNLVWVKKEG